MEVVRINDLFKITDCKERAGTKKSRRFFFFNSERVLLAYAWEGTNEKKGKITRSKGHGSWQYYKKVGQTRQSPGHTWGGRRVISFITTRGFCSCVRIEVVPVRWLCFDSWGGRWDCLLSLKCRWQKKVVWFLKIEQLSVKDGWESWEGVSCEFLQQRSDALLLRWGSGRARLIKVGIFQRRRIGKGSKLEKRFGGGDGPWNLNGTGKRKWRQQEVGT